jgi:hypothetical protein
MIFACIQLIHMKVYIVLFLVATAATRLTAQTHPKAAPPGSAPTTIPQMKAELENSSNPILYARDILKKRYKIDTIIVSRTRRFNGLADSIAYTGKEKKVYGPYGPAGRRFLVQLLSKAPNQFYHVGQIFIDTAIFRRRVADSLADAIIAKVKKGSATFEEMAATYSMGGEAVTKGDLGWIARGVLQPTIEHELLVHKKGDVFKLWSPAGLHVIRKTDDPKQDTGFALMLQIFL